MERYSRAMERAHHQQVLLALLFGTIAMVLIVAAGTWGARPGPEGLARSGAFSAGTLASLAIAGALWSRRPTAHALGWTPVDRGVSGATQAILVAGALGLSMGLDVALAWAEVWEGSRLEWLDRALYDASANAWAPLFMGLALAPGIAEELLFRGLILGSLARRVGVASGLLISAAIFGAIHLDAAQGAAAAVIGLYLGCVVIVTGSIRVAVIAHVANNSFALLDGVLLDPDRDATRADVLGLVVGLALVLLAVRILARQLPEQAERFVRALRADEELLPSTGSFPASGSGEPGRNE